MTTVKLHICHLLLCKNEKDRPFFAPIYNGTIKGTVHRMKKSLSSNTVKILFILFNGNPMAAFGFLSKVKSQIPLLTFGPPHFVAF